MANHVAGAAIARGHSLESLRALAEGMLRRYESDARGEDPETTLVFVLGAEASRASCLQDWKNFGHSLVDELSGKYLSGDYDAFLDDALTRLQPLIGPAPRFPADKRAFLKTARTEQILEVACRNAIFESVVREELAAAYGPKRAPQLGHELVAHFLRHRFIDHVINLNWDEILDRAIEDEVGRDGYEQVLPSGRAPASTRADVPRLFKLHGTASSPGSLRFTTAETGLLSLAMMELLDESLFGIKPSEPDREGNPRKCHLVSFGYGWTDPDFINYVVAHWERFERITVVRRSPGYPEEVERLFRQAVKHVKWDSPAGKGRISVVSVRQLGAVAGGTGGIPLVDHVLWALWERIHKKMARRPRGKRLRLTPVARHILLGLYFAPRRNGVVLPLAMSDDDYRLDPGRLFDYRESLRLQIEFLLHVMKSNGMVNLSPMGVDPRIAGALGRAGSAQPLYDLLDQPRLFQRSPTSSMRETYFLMPARRRPGERSPKMILVGGARTVETALGMKTAARNTTPRPVWQGDDLSFLEADVGRLYRECARQVFEADDVEVVAAGDPRNRALFLKPRELTSFARLSRESTALLSEPWNVLLVIAESGRWIFNALAELYGSRSSEPSGRRVFLIRTSGHDLDKWEIGRAYDVGIEGKIRELGNRGIKTLSVAIPWWRHNRHMTLAVRREGDALQLGKGIYFRRRLKDHRIAPVLVGETGDGRAAADAAAAAEDCFELLLLFLGYAVRAVDWYQISAFGRLGKHGPSGLRPARGRTLGNLKGFADELVGVAGRVPCASGRSDSARSWLCDEIGKKIKSLQSAVTGMRDRRRATPR